MHFTSPQNSLPNRTGNNATHELDIARWAMDSSKPNWKAGKVTFRDPSDSEMKALTWEEGFVTSYEETIPHVKDSPDDQIYESFEISAHKLVIGDAEIDNRWEE